MPSPRDPNVLTLDHYQRLGDIVVGTDPASVAVLSTLGASAGDVITLDGSLRPVWGAGGGGGGFTPILYVFGAPSTTWSVAHNLGHTPAIVEVIVGTLIIEADVTFPDVNHALITFATVQTGSAWVG